MADAPVSVLVIAGMLTPGGAEKQLAYHVRCLAEAGVNVTVVSLDGPGYYGPMISACVRELAFVDESWGRAGRLARLVRLARRVRPDFVQSTHTFSNVYAIAAARASGAFSVGALRGVLQTTIDHNRLTARWQLTVPDAVISNSARAARELKERFGRQRGVHVLGNVIDLRAFDAALRPRVELRTVAGAQPGDVLVMGLGTMTKDKDFALSLRALELARARVPRLKAVIIGDGPELAHLRALREASPVLREGVVIAGRHAHASKLMRGADCFLMTSRNEGVPNTLVEAMAAGLPCVVTPAGDAGSIVEGAEAGFVCAFGDAEALAASLVAVACDAAARKTCGENARRFAETELDVASLWPRLRGIYAQIARDGGRDSLLTA